MDNIIIYLVTCDATSYILPATIYLYKKFIQPCPLIRILGFSKPVLPDWNNIEFISLAPKQESVNLWSKYIYNYLKNIDDDLVYFALDDFFPIDYLNKKCYDYVINYMKKNSVGFCGLSQQPSSCPKRNEVESIIHESEEVFIYKRKKPINYQLCLQPGIWNKKYLVEALSIPISPWGFELSRTTWANNNTIFFNISTSDFPTNNYKCLLPYSEQSALSSKWLNLISVLGLRHEYVKELINNNLLDKNKLIIGAWNNYVMWNELFTKNDLIELTKNPIGITWYNLYKKYYI